MRKFLSILLIAFMLAGTAFADTVGQAWKGWKKYVDVAASLPTAGNSIGDVRYDVDDQVLYGWDGASWTIINTGSFLPVVLPSAQIYVGNASNVATARAVTGDISISNTGVTAVADDSHNHTGTTLSGIGIADTTITASLPLIWTVDDISIPAATNFVDGYLTAADHISFEAKLSAEVQTLDSVTLLGASTANLVTLTGGLTLGADDDTSNLILHSASTIQMYDDSDDTSITIGPVGNGTTTLGVTGTINATGLQVGGSAVLTAEVQTLDAVTTLGSTTTNGIRVGDILSGAAGVDGKVSMYSEQGVTDWTVTLNPNAAMGENVDLYLPASYPIGTYFLKVGATGIMTYDASTYLTAEAQTLDAVTTLGGTTVNAITAGTIQTGAAGVDGQFKIYSEQGATDYTATINPNVAMTSDANFYLPVDEPAATYFLTMTSGGVMGYDTSSYVALTGAQNVAGVKSFTSFPETPAAMPTTDYQVANKAYADSIAAGLTPKAAVRVATTGALPACTYAPAAAFTLTADANGVLPDQDGKTLVATNRILVKNQADAKQNGIYTVTDVGVADPGGSPWILTRASDYNTTAEVVSGTFCYVSEGTTLIAYQFVQTTFAPTLDTNDLVFTTLYAPIAETLNTVTTRGATTTNAITIGRLTDTGGNYQQGITNLGNGTMAVTADMSYIYVTTTAGAQVNLPPATASGRVLVIKRKDATAFTVTIHADTTGTPDLIDGEADILLSNQYDSLTIHDSSINEWSIN